MYYSKSNFNHSLALSIVFKFSKVLREMKWKDLWRDSSLLLCEFLRCRKAKVVQSHCRPWELRNRELNRHHQETPALYNLWRDSPKKIEYSIDRRSENSNTKNRKHAFNFVSWSLNFVITIITFFPTLVWFFLFL